MKVSANERGPAKHALAISNQKTIVSHECDGDRSLFSFLLPPSVNLFVYHGRWIRRLSRVYFYAGFIVRLLKCPLNPDSSKCSSSVSFQALAGSFVGKKKALVPLLLFALLTFLSSLLHDVNARTFIQSTGPSFEPPRAGWQPS